MKKIVILLSVFSIINFAFAQNIDCNELINIDIIAEKFIHNNSYSEEEIIANKNISGGMIVSEKAIKLTNGSYGNLNDNTYFLATIASCEAMKSQNESNIVKDEELIIEEQKIVVYPNPSTDFVKVQWSNQKVEAIFLTTIEGKVLKSQAVSTEMKEVLFDVSNLTKGIYQVLLVENGKNKVFKIIKN